jgi:Ala-tRNA(Pro) deacylase
MPTSELKAFLDEKKIRYATTRHAPTYTAQGTAAVTHTPGKELAKTVMIRVDGELAMAVVPASHRVDPGKVKKAAKAKKVELALEADFKEQFPDCELGAMPPFGNLYGMKVYVSEVLSADEEISFNACSHTELMRMSFADYKRVVKPKIVPMVTGD